MIAASRPAETMAAAELRAELAEILAKGYVRMLAKGRISYGELAQSPEIEASCPQAVYAPETRRKDLPA